MEYVYDKPLITGRRLCSLLVNADSNMPPQPIDDDVATNKDDLVSKESFSNFIDMATSIPRMYGYAPTNTELYKTEDEMKQARGKMFNSMDLKGTGVITVAEWFKFCVEHIIAKAATLTEHPILVRWNMKEFKAFVNSVFSDVSRDVSSSANADIDTNKDGLVSRESFSKLVDMAASIPRMYGYVPTDVELYKTEDEKEQARRKTFDSMDFKGTDVITVDEWLQFCVKHIIAKAATLAAHPILDHGPEHMGMYWFLLELFTESDPDEDGIVILTNFSALFPAIMGSLMFRVMSLHQLMQAVVAKKLLLNMEIDVPKELPLNMEMEVAKELLLNMGMEVTKELPLNMEVKVTMEPRRGDRRSKEATQLHNTALPCSIVHCRVPQPKTTCSCAVVNLITHTGQINYFRFELCFVNINASLHYFCGASGYVP